MPIIGSEYKSPVYLWNGHIQTILPALFRRVGTVVYNRERILTPDNDFLDLDWSTVNSDTLILISHGLEGSSDSVYALGMVRAVNLYGWDALVWNYRGCSGELNKQYRFYHSGETTDLQFVVNYAISREYKKIAIIGFSVGGNISLKFLGELGHNLHSMIKACVTFSVPCHLQSSASNLAKWSRKIYMNRFLKSLEKKIRAKALVMPDKFDCSPLKNIKNFQQFDDLYTAPMHGYANALEYWEKNSSIYFIENIQLPTLIVTAKNDPFLAPECYPVRQVSNHPYVFLEMPEQGGHCGFFQNNKEGLYWSEKRAIEFIAKYC